MSAIVYRTLHYSLVSAHLSICLSHACVSFNN